MGDLADIAAVESRTGHALSRSHFLGQEGSRQKSEDSWFGYPLFWLARDDGKGGHIVYGKFEDVFYLAKQIFDPRVREPIPFTKSGRSGQ